MSVEFVFFDAGETLLSPNPSWAGLSAKVLAARGHAVDPQALEAAWREVGHRFRRAADDGLRFSLDVDASRSFWTALYADILGELHVHDDEAPQALYSTFSDPASYRLFDDARPCLDALRASGLRLGIISNFEGWLSDLLDRLGIAAHFEVVAISGRLGWEKPDPRIFEWSVREAGLPPSACAHVGDQPFFDAEAAADSGLRGVLLDRFGRYEGDGARYPTIASLDELPAVVASL